MRRITAFLRGLIEAGSDITTHYADPFIEWYDKGRNLGQHLTMGDNQ